MMTNYYVTWIKFRKSKEYKRLWDIIKKHGHGQRYANNILRQAFDAGWGDRKIIETKNTNP
jgi:hypothetical protein